MDYIYLERGASPNPWGYEDLLSFMDHADSFSTLCSMGSKLKPASHVFRNYHLYMQGTFPAAGNCVRL
jgi:hypothetical protein